MELCLDVRSGKYSSSLEDGPAYRFYLLVVPLTGQYFYTPAHPAGGHFLNTAHRQIYCNVGVPN